MERLSDRSARQLFPSVLGCERVRPQAGDPTDPAALTELLKDIPPIHTWPKALALGHHPNRTDIPQNNVVLLVRGELFNAIPTWSYSPGKALRKAEGKRGLDDTDERYPIFRGTLPPDITFLGFNFSLDDARGGPRRPRRLLFRIPGAAVRAALRAWSRTSRRIRPHTGPISHGRISAAAETAEGFSSFRTWAGPRAR